jgi:hypothetical protein
MIAVYQAAPRTTHCLKQLRGIQIALPTRLRVAETGSFEQALRIEDF